jgi:hypothetical protein
MTREILKLIRKKRRKWRTAKNSHAESDMKEYKRVEKEVSNKIRNAKRKLEKGLVSGPDKNNRKYTQYVKSKTKSRTPVGPLVTKEKKIVTENKEMAEILNQCLHKRGPQLHSGCRSGKCGKHYAASPGHETRSGEENQESTKRCSSWT